MKYWEEACGIDIIHIKHETLCEALEAEVKTLLQQLDLQWDSKCARPDLNNRIIQTASTKQVRARVYTGSSEEWRKYGQFLKEYI